jgi:hypothetical protein
MNDLIIKQNYLNEENKIINSLEKLKEKNNFKYFEEKYLNDVLSKISFTNNYKDNNIFYLFNITNTLNNSSKFNYKVINPKDKTELESLVMDFYNENKLNCGSNKSNDSSHQLFEINPLMILNEEQMIQLNEKFNKLKTRDSASITGTESKKDNHDTTYTISKQIAIDYEIIEQSISNISKTEKNSEARKIYQNFGQSTPISMLYDKFLIFSVSRNIKYCVHSPQSNIYYPNIINRQKNSTNAGFSQDKLNINKFYLWIEKIEKINSINSSDKK